MKFEFLADRTIRADRLLSRELPFLGRSYCQKLFRNKEVKTDSKAIAADTELKQNEELTVFLPDPRRHLDKLIGCTIIFENEKVIAINKSSGITSVPGVGTGGASLLESAEKLLQMSLIAVHRLDKGTSGVIIFAKTSNEATLLEAEFRARQARKVYFAVTDRAPTENTGTITEPLKRLGERVIVDPAGQPAETSWEVIERRTDGSALIACQPITGRTHQIRVHLAHLGYPITGDEKYDGQSAKRLYLHAGKLAILDYEIEAKLPKEMSK